MIIVILIGGIRCEMYGEVATIVTGYCYNANKVEERALSDYG